MGVEKDLTSSPAGAAAAELSRASLLRPHRAGPEQEHRGTPFRHAHPPAPGWRAGSRDTYAPRPPQLASLKHNPAVRLERQLPGFGVQHPLEGRSWKYGPAGEQLSPPNTRVWPVDYEGIAVGAVSRDGSWR